jgi:hypothetical protein
MLKRPFVGLKSFSGLLGKGLLGKGLLGKGLLGKGLLGKGLRADPTAAAAPPSRLDSGGSTADR